MHEAPCRSARHPALGLGPRDRAQDSFAAPSV